MLFSFTAQFNQLGIQLPTFKKKNIRPENFDEALASYGK